MHPALWKQLPTLSVSLSISLYYDIGLVFSLYFLGLALESSYGPLYSANLPLSLAHTPLLTQLWVHGPSFSSSLASNLNFIACLPCKPLNASNCHFSPSLQAEEQPRAAEGGGVIITLANTYTASPVCQALSASHIVSHFSLQQYEGGTSIIIPTCGCRQWGKLRLNHSPNPKHTALLSWGTGIKPMQS